MALYRSLFADLQQGNTSHFVLEWLLSFGSFCHPFVVEVDINFVKDGMICIASFQCFFDFVEFGLFIWISNMQRWSRSAPNNTEPKKPSTNGR